MSDLATPPRPYTDHFAWMAPGWAPWARRCCPQASSPWATPEGLPVGAQLVAPCLEDHSAPASAGLLAREAGGYEPPPGFDGPGGLR